MENLEDIVKTGWQQKIRYVSVFMLLLIVFFAIVVLNINIGSVPIPVAHIAEIILTGEGEPTQVAIIWKIRMPRILMAALLGGALSLAGYLLQTFFANPIAGPFELGISSGAKMVVALTMIYFLERFQVVSSWTMIFAAFIGALIAVGFILILARRFQHMATLLVGGIMIGYLCSAVTDFVITFAEDSDIVNLHGWSQGSFSGTNWENLGIAAIIVCVASVLVFMLSKPIAAYQMGEAHARSVGVNIQVFRVTLIVLSSLLAACVTAFAGPISFVGIAVPHLVKRGLNTAKPIVVIPAVFLGGAVFCTGCDLIARTAFAPMELNISTVTAVFGAPVVIAMLMRRHKER